MDRAKTQIPQIPADTVLRYYGRVQQLQAGLGVWVLAAGFGCWVLGSGFWVVTAFWVGLVL